MGKKIMLETLIFSNNDISTHIEKSVLEDNLLF